MKSKSSKWIWFLYFLSQIVMIVLKKKGILFGKIVWIPSYILLGLLIVAIILNVPDAWEIANEMESRRRTGMTLREVEEEHKVDDVFGGDLDG